MALDPSYFFYSDGTITLTNGSDIATGNFTAWDPAVLPFDFVFPNDGTAGMSVIEEVLGMDQIRLAKPWTGPTLTDVPYFMVRWTRHTDPRIYAVRVSDYLARLKAIPDNIEEVAGEINADRQAVEAAMTALAAIEAAVDADRQAAETAAGTATGAASAAAASADEAEAWAQAASSTVLPDDSVTNVKLANMAVNTIKGRATAGTGDPEDLTPAQARSVIGVPWTTTVASLTSPVAAVDLAAPAGSTLAKFKALIPNDNATQIAMRVSVDGGASYISTNSNYGYGSVTHDTNAGVVAYGNTGPGTSWPLNQASATTSIPILIEGEIDLGGPSKRARLGARSSSYDGSVGSRLTQTSGFAFNSSGFGGTITNIRFMPTSGNMPAGTLIVVEWL